MKISKLSFLLFILFGFIVLMPTNLQIKAFSPAGDSEYKGIDVSRWQGDIDYAKVKETGIEVVYIKSSQGNASVDPYFETNYTEAKKHDLKVGFYHYVTAETTAEAKEQARYFASVIEGKDIDCKLAMDFESFGDLDVETINEIALTFLETLEKESDSEALIYSNYNNAKNVFTDELSSYSLWFAEYGTSEPRDPGKWEVWAGFQYSDTGEIDGIEADVDLNIFTNEVFLVKKSSTKDTTTDDIIELTIEYGDTLFSLAKKYGTTVNAIASENQIENPDLIYVGEVINIYTTDTTNQLTKKSYVINSGDTLSQIAQNNNVTLDNLMEWNQIENPDLILEGDTIIIYN